MCGTEGDVGAVTELWKVRLKQFGQFPALIQPVMPAIKVRISSILKTFDMSGLRIPHYSHISLDPIVPFLLISSTHAEGQRKPHRLQGWQVAP